MAHVRRKEVVVTEVALRIAEVAGFGEVGGSATEEFFGAEGVLVEGFGGELKAFVGGHRGMSARS